jgi:hypothetical protein
MTGSDPSTEASSPALVKSVGVALSLLSVPIAAGGAYAVGAPDDTLRVLGLALDGWTLLWTALAFGAGGLAVAVWLEWGTE